MDVPILDVARRPEARHALRPALYALLLGGSLAGCATGSGSAAAAPGEPVKLDPGEVIVLPDDARLRYVEVTADSRCPPDVQCIRAGDADVRFQFDPADAPPRPVTLNTPQSPSTVLGGWRVRLLALEFGSAPAVTVEFEPAVP